MHRIKTMQVILDNLQVCVIRTQFEDSKIITQKFTLATIINKDIKTKGTTCI